MGAMGERRDGGHEEGCRKKGEGVEGEERGGVREEERRNERKRRKHNLLISDSFPTKSNSSNQLQFGVKLGLQSETEISAHLFVFVSRFSRA